MTKEQYFQLRRKLSNQLQLSDLLTDYGLTLLIIALAILPWLNSQTHIVFKILSPFLLAIAMYRSFALFHEGTHRQLHKKSWLNDALGIVISPLCLLPFEPWKMSHLQHHSWSGNVDKDPVMGFIKIYPKLNIKVKAILNMAWKNWIPVLALVQHVVFWSLSIINYKKSDKNIKMTVSLFFPLIAWMTLLYFSSIQFILIALLPAVAFYMIGTEVINLPHHLQLETEGGEKKYPLWEQYQTARSCEYHPLISRWIVLHFNYHIEHHLYPDAPWRKLQEIQIETKNILKEKYKSDPQFSWIIKARRFSLSEILSANTNSTERANTIEAHLNSRHSKGITTTSNDLT